MGNPWTSKSKSSDRSNCQSSFSKLRSISSFPKSGKHKEIIWILCEMVLFLMNYILKKLLKKYCQVFLLPSLPERSMIITGSTHHHGDSAKWHGDRAKWIQYQKPPECFVDQSCIFENSGIKKCNMLWWRLYLQIWWFLVAVFFFSFIC